jgi:hypothetical protein
MLKTKSVEKIETKHLTKIELDIFTICFEEAISKFQVHGSVHQR